MYQVMTHAEYVDSLRQLADFYEAHSEIPLPGGAAEMRIYQVNSRKDAATLARAFGACEKEYTDDLFYITKKIGAISLCGVFTRNEVCERVVVGTRIVPERVVPAIQAQPEQVIPEQEEEIYEWKCSPILGDEAAAQ